MNYNYKENTVANVIFTATKILGILSAIGAIFISYTVAHKEVVTEDYWGDPKIETAFSVSTFIGALIAFAITIFIICLAFYAVGEIIRMQQETLNVLTNMVKEPKTEETKPANNNASNASCKPLIDTWECTSCGQVNDATALTCTNCGMRK